MDATRQATGSGHLWAIGYDDMERADQVRDKITTLGWGGPYFQLSDVSVAVRHPAENDLPLFALAELASPPGTPFPPPPTGCGSRAPPASPTGSTGCSNEAA